MKQFTINDIRAWNPCYDPNKYLAEDWKGTALDILDDKRIPFFDRLWVVLRTDLLSEKLMRLFAVWCARQVEHLMTDERSKFALEFMEAYCEWRYLIDDPDWIETWELERDAARAVAWAATRAVAWAATRAATRAAAWTAAWDAAWTAAWDAARDAAGAAAGAAAWAAAWDAQESKLRSMILAGVETRDTL